MDLKLATHQSENTLYLNQLTEAIGSYSSTLLEKDTWDKAFVESQPYFLNEHIGPRKPIEFGSLPTLLKHELKLYWVKFLSDSRCNSIGNVERRRQPMEWFQQEASEILQRFSAQCLADIPHPEFPITGHAVRVVKRQHNRDLLTAFESFGGAQKHHAKVAVETLKSGELGSKDYFSSRVSIIGDFHKRAIILREQLQALSRRNIVFLNDIYDAQRQSDQYLNFYLFPEWLRPAVKTHVLQKVSFGELSPKTLMAYLGRQGKFRDFMHEQFSEPEPGLITENLIEDTYVAWGNAKGFAGKNWFTETIAMLNTAARTWPSQWPSVSVSNRATRKIKKVHYKQGLGRIGRNQECANRAYS